MWSDRGPERGKRGGRRERGGRWEENTRKREKRGGQEAEEKQGGRGKSAWRRRDASVSELLQREKVCVCILTWGSISLARLSASLWAASPVWFCSTALFTSPISRAVCPPTRLPDNRQTERAWYTKPSLNDKHPVSIATCQRFCNTTCEDELFGQSDADHPRQPLTAPCRTNHFKVNFSQLLCLSTYTPCSTQGHYFVWPLFILPAPGSSPRVVSIRPICAEYAETHTNTEDNWRSGVPLGWGGRKVWLMPLSAQWAQTPACLARQRSANHQAATTDLANHM